jgi:CRP/FNR family transcriptional regulator, cyclic AMP receptor protein
MPASETNVCTMRRSPYGFDIFDNCLTCRWHTEQFFCAVEPHALEAFDQLAFTNVYPQGSVLFSEGDPARGVFMMCRGSVKLSVGSGDGKLLITRIVHAGEALGLSSVISGHDYRATAETIEPCQVKFVKREDFVRWMNEYHEACRHASVQLSEECEVSNDHIRALGLSHSAAEKLAHMLLNWAAEEGKEQDGSIKVQMLMTHQDISQIIGTSRETVTRLLKEFRDKGLVTLKGSSLTIHNKGALEGLVLI